MGGVLFSVGASVEREEKGSEDDDESIIVEMGFVLYFKDSTFFFK